MARLNEREDKLTITNWFKMAKTATMQFVNSSGVTQSISANELATQTTGGRGTSLITTKTVLATETGKTFFLNLAAGFTVTLPEPAEGLKYKFIVATAPTTAYIIVTNGSDNIIQGSVCSPEVVALVSVVADADDINFVANLAVKGDYVELESDGTSWFLSGMVFVQDGITTTTT